MNQNEKKAALFTDNSFLNSNFCGPWIVTWIVPFSVNQRSVVVFSITGIQMCFFFVQFLWHHPLWLCLVKVMADSARSWGFFQVAFCRPSFTKRSPIITRWSPFPLDDTLWSIIWMKELLTILSRRKTDYFPWAYQRDTCILFIQIEKEGNCKNCKRNSWTMFL